MWDAPLQLLSLQHTGLTCRGVALCCKLLEQSRSLRVMELGPPVDISDASNDAESDMITSADAAPGLQPQQLMVSALEELVTQLPQQLHALQLWGLTAQQQQKLQGDWSGGRGRAVHSSGLHGGGVRLSVLSGCVASVSGAFFL